jgi:hypothetical protein
MVEFRTINDYPQSISLPTAAKIQLYFLRNRASFLQENHNVIQFNFHE